MVDVDGNTYKTIKIHNTLWMAENLRVEHDTSGEKLDYFFPNEDSTNIKSYGLLYDFENACKSCPKGWRIPNNKEWEALFDFTKNNIASNYKDNSFWNDESNSNSTKFSARPAGIGNSQEHPNNFNEKILFWSNSKEEEHFIWAYIFEKGKNKIRKASQHPTYAFSVRCIKN
ncbi:FISUMP domain-containing protein [uncultured Algibacter sp.]|uniref:FISUMP domain-containing protein n=1 Tax=uncultured Algibacter sp. TaxID=298659 RepID=UPI0026255FC4|nr:FISUMP domain-containing protein [uncultured Algibacter sp.]